MAAMADDGCGLDDRLEHELGVGTVTSVVLRDAVLAHVPSLHGSVPQAPRRQGTTSSSGLGRRDAVRDHAALHRAVAARFRERVNAA